MEWVRIIGTALTTRTEDGFTASISMRDNNEYLLSIRKKGLEIFVVHCGGEDNAMEIAQSFIEYAQAAEACMRQLETRRESDLRSLKTLASATGSLATIKYCDAELATLQGETSLDKSCPTCKGHGTEICDNPDHGFIDAVAGVVSSDIGRLGCPCCGHDEHCRIPGSVCPDCAGTGVSDPNVDVLGLMASREVRDGD